MNDLTFTFDDDSGEIGPGQWDVEITEAVAGVNKKGNNRLKVVYRKEDGQVLTDWLVQLPQSKWVWHRLFEAAGIEVQRADGTVTFDAQELIGARVTIEVEEQTWEGQTRPRVKDVYRPIGSDVPNTGVADHSDSSFAQAAGLEPADDEVPY